MKAWFWRGLILLALAVSGKSFSAEQQVLKVFRSPTCSCCEKWVGYMKQNGFTVEEILTSDLKGIKEKLGVPHDFQSCHTAVWAGYLIEGHVPLNEVIKLKAKPKVRGISVPGMPRGTPGMEVSGIEDPYTVQTFGKSPIK